MKDEYEEWKRVFDLLLDADKKIWEAVLAAQADERYRLNWTIEPLMGLRGELHVELLRPIYKRFPEIAKAAGMDLDEE